MRTDGNKLLTDGRSAVHDGAADLGKPGRDCSETAAANPRKKKSTSTLLNLVVVEVGAAAIVEALARHGPSRAGEPCRFG